MTKLTYPKPVLLDGEALTAELAARGVTVAKFGIALEIPDGGTEASTLAVTVPDGTSATTVAQVVAAHTGTPVSRTKARNDAQTALNALLSKAVAGTTLAAADLQVIARHYVLNNAQ